MKLKKFLWNSLFAISILVLFYMIYQFAMIRLNANTYESQNKEFFSTKTPELSPSPSVAPTVLPSVVPSNTPSPEEKVIQDKFKEAYEKNNDLIGQLKIDELLSLPVMYTPDDAKKPDDDKDKYYYLYRDIYKKHDKHGTPFLDYRTNFDTTTNFIIYGHNMRSDGTVFHDLLGYKEKDFLNDHRYIEFNTLYENRTYEVYAVIESDYKGFDGFRYYNKLDLREQSAFDDYVTMIDKMAIQKTDVTLTYPCELLTLSTCAKSKYKEGPYKNGRLAIIAKRVDYIPD